MARIPVVTSFGGINAAGRSSGHHGYRRVVIDALDEATAQETWRSLAAIMNIQGDITAEMQRYIEAHTLVRKLETQYFDASNAIWNRKLALRPGDRAICFDLPRRDLPDLLPEGWGIDPLDDKTVRVSIEKPCEMYVQDGRDLAAKAAGQLPTGFEPQALYAARNHPRGLQMALYAASDALGNLGLDWQMIADRVPADAISLYAGSAMTQLDTHGNGGALASRYQGKRITSKQVTLGLAEMPADFVNAYVLGNLGTSGHNMGACATALYNLRLGVQDIRSGRARVAIVGGSEAPLVPDVMDGLITMGALGSDQALLALDQDKGATEPDYRRACRPFAENIGFTIAEGAQYIVLMDDELALELGADIHAVVADVYINADGHKKSISSPGVGNYITFAKAVSLGCQIVGEEAVRHRSFVQAHGTGTPQNRVTESQILNRTAAVFGIQDWPVVAIKCFLGHTMAVSGLDQLANSLGIFRYGIIPGVTTIDGVAGDVYASHLRIAPEHLERDQLDVAFLNAKGFGGNNATATVLPAHVSEKLLEQKHGAQTMATWRDKAESARAQAQAYDRDATAGNIETIYHFDHDVRADEHIHISRDELRVDGYQQPISLATDNPLDLTL
ncbi:beta-ketoacyl synthase [Candidatus Entotheonella palauensis]|uniref:beta-ketoacyl synthase n=1 Tax=Candidatus Entotheonella palauensis TaxID=93172 RepID=UPI000B7E7DC6|nr:beta-ketoacyl synthase [Candidatus Entotheonella palauensis]